MSKKKRLTDYAKDYFSQHGEDGIIQHILTMIPQISSQTCFEVGAWDGLYLSNTAHLWKNRGWRGVLAEANNDKCLELINNVRGSNCYLVRGFVESEGNMSVDSILEEAGIKIGPGVACIDVDGQDYHILNGIKKYAPDIIVIEYNPTIPANIDIFQTDAPGLIGSSSKALTRLARDKGYTLVAVTLTNLIFVHDLQVGEIKQEFITGDELRNDMWAKNNVIGTFMGDYLILDGEIKQNAQLRGHIWGSAKAGPYEGEFWIHEDSVKHVHESFMTNYKAKVFKEE